MDSTEPPYDKDASARHQKAVSKVRRLMAGAVILPVLAVAVFAALSQAQFLEFRWSVLLKLGAGVFATIVLAAGLMAASFYSDQSGHDDEPADE